MRIDLLVLDIDGILHSKLKDSVISFRAKKIVVKRPTMPITDQGNARGNESKRGPIKGKERSKKKIGKG